ncbi:heme-binding protein [Tumebacillus sp. DT12]|uniref:Heme-binding protein n=1 Tax=Tumebacillus lacus TaxID=2995335 RepID=A0ABT3X429_9BACL|nr:heme-binding protein [Tumebacillus lacus]MCX7571651.1 heme-binding protein [Tumebacillus lacus]
MTFEKASISADTAKKIIEAAEAKAKEMGVPSSIAIVDESGVLKAFSRMDGAALLSIEIAKEKAYTGAGFGMPTHEVFNFISTDQQLLTGLPLVNKLSVVGGGFPIMIDGKLVGGIGISGGHYTQDMAIAEAALSAAVAV